MSARAAAIDAAFITASDADQMDPVRMDALRAEAERTGKMLVQMPRKSHDRGVLDEHAHHVAALPKIARGDDRAFLKNLDKIARGELVVG